MKAFTQMKEAAFGDKPRERSLTKLSDWTGPAERTVETGERGMIDSWIVDEVMRRCGSYLPLYCAPRQMHGLAGGVSFVCRGGSAYIKLI